MPEYLDQKNDPKNTLRQQIRKELERGFLSCRDLSQAIHRCEKEILDHLEHLRLSLRHQGKNLAIDPAVCRNCSYVFDHRTRLTKPGKCPVCKKTSIEAPLFSIAGN